MYGTAHITGASLYSYIHTNIYECHRYIDIIKKYSRSIVILGCFNWRKAMQTAIYIIRVGYPLRKKEDCQKFAN